MRDPNFASVGLSRRRFVADTGKFALSAACLSLGAAVAAPVAKLLVGCRDTHLKAAGKADSWSCMQAIGAECVEVEVNDAMLCPSLVRPGGAYSLATEDGIHALKEDLRRNGLRISAFMMANRLDERLEQEMDWTEKVVVAADQLGVKAIRIDVVPRRLKAEEFLPFAVKACSRLCKIADGTTVRFGVENHGTITNDPEFLDKLFQGVGSSRLGLTLDCANLYWWGHPLESLYGIYGRFAARVIHTHCKSIRYPEDKRNIKRSMGWEYGKYNCPIYEGDIDFRRLVKILKQAGYTGDLCLEDESLGRFPEADRAGILTREIALLKTLV